MKIPEFKTKKELFKFLVENKETLIMQKKAETKHADAFSFGAIAKTAQVKSEQAKDSIQVKAVINTTNIMDSHSDVHWPGLWDKSLKERGSKLLHLQEHKMEFDKIISKGFDLKASTKTMTWQELGINFEGKTEALIFDSTIRKNQNAYMFEQYSKGYVDNHSVGMQYVKMLMAINDEDYPTEKEIWDKYFPDVANKDVAEEKGYFWVIKEAKVIEGSAVPIGSNWATPTLDIKEEPEQSTHKTFSEQLKEVKILN